MRVRWAGLALALVLVGLAAGYGAGALLRAEPTTFAEARPVHAVSPSIPVMPTAPFAPDIDYPALGPDLQYREHRLGDPPYQWAYDAPRGWTSTTTDSPDELRWRPADEPTVGGFSMRVKLVTERKTPEEMVAQKLDVVRSIYEDVEVLGETADQLGFTYREPDENTQRFDMFQWFVAPGGTEADFEMSVAGRGVDQSGMQDLLEHVAASVRKVPS
jgi:hypothetical protein